MRVLLIGAGNMGRGIATRLLAGGHDVTVYDTNPEASRQLAADLAQLPTASARIAVTNAPADAVPASDIVVLASWYASNLEVAQQLGSSLDGKVVVDISNPLNDTYDGLVTAPDTSAAETIRAVLPSRAKVVKAFNTTFAGTLTSGQVAGQPLDVFIAGDDEGAKATVANVVRDGGLTAVDVGGLVRARQLEGLALLGITMQGRLSTGFMSGWRFVSPN